MEAPLDPGPVDVDAMRIDVLRRAVEIYLKHAYPTGEYPENVKRRISWGEGAPPRDLFAKPPFERAGKTPGTQSPIYALRLGNGRYPHMKLQFQPWNNAEGLMLSVNTHDQVAGLDLVAEDVDAFKRLQSENQRLKEEIEQAWEAESLPTFLNFLRSYIESRSGDDEPEGGIGA
ncbi:hypothetical protein [Planctomyces sp. SH-PL62]|uniref:hypothetical protein n=1 Tax=Planctomyces sp. SH-PL62 TaxID=1636152 RepID=UPI00078EDE98|nr:hypothetical protein [Planctomyces sp. SH-PL62]AMV40626.1 hypothetical protein VT85_24560 [Planctomyces sp. SH-PL62]